MNDSIKATGAVEFIIVDTKTGKQRIERQSNLVVTKGKNWIASRMEGANDSVMTHMAVGIDGSLAPTDADEFLASELPDGRVLLEQTIVSEKTVTYTASWPAGEATGDWEEAGIFRGIGPDHMLCRATFQKKPKSPTDSVVINWTITIG